MKNLRYPQFKISIGYINLDLFRPIAITKAKLFCKSGHAFVSGRDPPEQSNFPFNVVSITVI